MAPDLIRQLATELLNFRLLDVQAIFAGVDSTGAHLYVANGSDISCQDGVGFAAIGVGAWHANSQLMFAGHTRERAFASALLSVYSAKKRAEVAPGVGEVTDMFMIGPVPGSYVGIGEHVLKKLEAIYRDSESKIGEIRREAERDATKYVKEVIASNTFAGR